tara:strand:- start:498 stop:2438 length:1941 start_codon:yes stop_codon:yes gene_type:complete
MACTWETLKDDTMKALADGLQPSRFDPDQRYYHALGASSTQTPRAPQVPHSGVSRGESSSLAVVEQSEDKAHAGLFLSHEEMNQLLLSEDALARAVGGDVHESFKSGRYVPHPISACKHRQPDGGPCWSNLWTRETLKRKRTQLLQGSREMVSTIIFHRLQSMLDCNNNNEWRYFCDSREVCQNVFLIENCISRAQLYKLQDRIKTGCLFAHEKHETGTAHAGRDAPSKSLAAVAWYEGYASVVGCYMPDEQLVVVPRRERTDEYGEYAGSLGREALQYASFCRVLRDAPELNHIVRARPKLNFQNCTGCSDSNAEIRSAVARGDRRAAEAAKAKRAAHIGEERGERLAYYGRRELGRDPLDNSLSLILDKCDSTKTTCPWFKRSPGAWWSAKRKECLGQHLLGVLVHGAPNRPFVYNVNESIKGNANLNIEGIRLTLASLFEARPMPSTLFIQADNASDNKCWAMLAFLGMLVHHGYTKDIFLSFLMVGHTHEDIDQLFSVIARHFRSIEQITTPSQFEVELQEALALQEPVLEPIKAVLDWASWLEPHIVSPRPVGIQHAVLPLGDEDDNMAVDTRSPHTFHIHRNPAGNVVLHYKELCTHSTWLPAVANSSPFRTDPEGIVLFQSPPPDPMVNPPQEAPFALV